MIRRLRGFTLIELLVVIAIIALLISILLPSLSRARELSKRLVCQSNIKGIGTTCKIYSNDHQERWPIPPFDSSVVGEASEAIEYRGYSKDEAEDCHTPGNGGGVAYERYRPSRSRSPGASTQLSVTRAYWMLVRTGSITVKQFLCPSSDDVEDATEDVELYYDFRCYMNISYGYQVPFGPRCTQPHEGMDNRQILAADKGPWYEIASTTTWDSREQTTGQSKVTLESSPKAWRSFNSQNHTGEGQVVLFADGHATFARTPAIGIDHDNIYTKIEYDWDDPQAFNLIHGELPGEFDPAPFPGQQALADTGTANDYACTDSLIYP